MAPSITTTTVAIEATSVNKDSLIVTDSHKDGAVLGRELVHSTLKERAGQVNTDLCEPGQEDAFFVADMGEVYRQHLRWKMNLKRVRPHYGESRTKNRVVMLWLTTFLSRKMQPRS